MTHKGTKAKGDEDGTVTPTHSVRCITGQRDNSKERQAARASARGAVTPQYLVLWGSGGLHPAEGHPTCRVPQAQADGSPVHHHSRRVVVKHCEGGDPGGGGN